jgi:hypothetical protein
MNTGHVVQRELQFLTLLRRWALEYAHDLKFEKNSVRYILDFNALFPYVAPYHFSAYTFVPKEMLQIFVAEEGDATDRNEVLETLIFSSTFPFINSLSEISVLPEPYKIELLSFLYNYKDSLLEFGSIDFQDQKKVGGYISSIQKTVSDYIELRRQDGADEKHAYELYKELLEPIPQIIRWIADPKNSPAARTSAISRAGLTNNFSRDMHAATESARTAGLHKAIYEELSDRKRKTLNLTRDVDALALTLQLNLDRSGPRWCFVTADDGIHKLFRRWYGERTYGGLLPEFPFVRHPIQFSPLFRRLGERVSSMDPFIRGFTETYDILFGLNGQDGDDDFKLWQRLLKIGTIASQPRASEQKSAQSSFVRVVAALSDELRNRIIGISSDASTRRALEMDIGSTRHEDVAKAWKRITTEEMGVVNDILAEGLKIQSNFVERSIELIGSSINFARQVDAGESSAIRHFDAVKYLDNAVSGRPNPLKDEISRHRSPWYFEFTHFQRSYIAALASGEMPSILVYVGQAADRSRAACATVNACVLGLRQQWLQAEKILENILTKRDKDENIVIVRDNDIAKPRHDDTFDFDEALLTYAIVLRLQTNPGQERLRRACVAAREVAEHGSSESARFRAKLELCVLTLSKIFLNRFHGSAYERPTDANVEEAYRELKRLAESFGQKRSARERPEPIFKRLFANLGLLRLLAEGMQPAISDLKIDARDREWITNNLREAADARKDRGISSLIEFLSEANQALHDPDKAQDHIAVIERLHNTAKYGLTAYDRLKIDDFLTFWREHRAKDAQSAS